MTHSLEKDKRNEVGIIKEKGEKMGKFLDLMLSENWETYKRIQLYKKLGDKLESLPPNKLNKIKKILEE